MSDEINEKECKCKVFFQNHKKAFIITSGILLLAAFLLLMNLLSNKFQLTASNGNVYRVNQVTGDVVMIKGTRLVRIDKDDTDKLGLYLREINIKNVNCNMMAVWRNDKLYYTFSVSPYTGAVKKIKQDSNYSDAHKGFNAKLLDANQFVIAEIPLKIMDLTEIVEDNGVVVKLEDKGKINLSYEDMKLIKDWTLTWNF